MINEHDKKEIENLKKRKEEYIKLSEISEEERIELFLRAMRGEDLV